MMKIACYFRDYSRMSHEYSPPVGNFASICIFRMDAEIRIEVQDRGKGISFANRAHLDIPRKAAVGIRGMRERHRQLVGMHHQ